MTDTTDLRRETERAWSRHYEQIRHRRKTSSTGRRRARHVRARRSRHRAWVAGIALVLVAGAMFVAAISP